MKFFKGRLLLFLTSLGILTAGAQNYAYLNASGGNMGQSATGADTSIYLFHENRIEKLDKNLNPLWANSYSNLTFNNILLSKSGKIFFIGAQDKVGMINPDGTIGWVTALNGSSVTGSSTLTALSNVNNKHLQLDRNGDLILTGGMGVYGFMIKLDTSGAFKKMRVFHFQSPSPSANMNNMAVISDSLGEYKLYADHHVSLSSSITQYVLNYSETSDVVTGMKTFNVGDGGSFSAPVTFFYKSRFANNFYIGVSVPKNTFNTYTRIIKYDVNSMKWNYNFGQWHMSNSFYRFNEDTKGNVTVVSLGPPVSGYTVMGCVRLDSSGAQVTNNLRYLNISGSSGVSSNIHVVHDGNYFFDVRGGYFPVNPVTLGKLDAALTCTTGMISGTLTSGSALANYTAVPVTYSAVITSTPAFTSVKTAISNYSTATNYCTVLGAEELSLKAAKDIYLFPNPGTGIYKINLPESITVERMEVYNAVGQTVLRSSSVPEDSIIDLGSFYQGIYFVRLETNAGVVTKKVVKE